MNDLLRSLEQERAKFAFDTANAIVTLRNAKNLDRINNLLKQVLEKENLISEEVFEQLKEGNNLPFDSKYQKELEDKLSTHIKKSAPLILTNGLGNTMAFYVSKKVNAIPEDVIKLKSWLSADKMAYAIAYDILNRWLKENGFLRDKNTVLDWFNDEGTSSLDVLWATQETLALLNWMKRFAQAMLEEEKEEEE